MRSRRQSNSRFKKGLSPILRSIQDRFKSIVNQKFTIMFIPHSEKKVMNFQVSTLLLGFISFLVLIMLMVFFYMVTRFSGNEQLLSEQESDLGITQANLDSILDEVGELSKVYDIFQSSINSTLDDLSIGSPEITSIPRSGDLSSISDLQEINNGEVPELYELRRLRESLSDAIGPLGSIAETLQTERRLLGDIPTLWPVLGLRGIVTMEYGPNIHPIFNTWYLHKGIDIAATPGIQIVASANGRVLEAGRNDSSGYGNYVLIEHKYGFRTRYSHLATINRSIEAGDLVVQGQRIGTLGSSGLSTGPHLDFQIMLGTEVLDPRTLLTIQNDITSIVHRRR